MKFLFFSLSFPLFFCMCCFCFSSYYIFCPCVVCEIPLDLEGDSDLLRRCYGWDGRVNGIHDESIMKKEATEGCFFFAFFSYLFVLST
ncbi:hypothetical protein, unlikely [Trypanosoma brucei gambiense DAL972]|uniref:T. brucei spp.-specific protein n=2 Tax=Trypanosoma brucei TaxID=5691 RepID=C9ZI99_TRYB9|nr:hypothetical protein, unlikely [Trypanosoma brucei gambiense DAL972]RHW74277.1 hypothetical protein DPX39_010019100 [Trypanosoma brucei equiperdum]CBH08891.1 hypothetical protein, unlikely [Trypanosoma brucei gambiense DAL972]|eukprot:XP_011771332.1 hypothetical protein, unlikely [Trypanosoma brucei gambiense DAL972]